MEIQDISRAIMAVLFAAGECVDAKRLAMALEVDEDEIKGPAHPTEDGEIVYDAVIDGETPYMDKYDEYYESVLELLTSGDLTDEEREKIENYFNILK